MASKTLKLGDVLEIQTPKGMAHLYYVGKHPEYGDVVRILPGFHQDGMVDCADLNLTLGYIAFYPARASVRQGLSRIIGCDKSCCSRCRACQASWFGL